ncbi:hypothetical protein AB6M97_06665 [Streptococcus hillyeri]|uniref:hypothetical protein n=1 Tax=Streptococcus hillyeri TaxID=2282420 RepID=UPI0034E1CFAA
MKSKAIKKLIGTGAIAFAFFSSSLAMETTVIADSIDSALKQQQFEEPSNQGFIDGYDLGYKNGNKSGAKNPYDSPPLDNLPSYKEINEDYSRGFKEGYNLGYWNGWSRLTDPNFIIDPVLDPDLHGQQHTEQPENFIDTIFGFFADIYAQVTTFFYSIW